MWHYCATLLKSTLLNKDWSAGSEILAKWSQGYIPGLLLKNHVPQRPTHVCPIGLNNVMRKNAPNQCVSIKPCHVISANLKSIHHNSDKYLNLNLPFQLWLWLHSTSQPVNLLVYRYKLWQYALLRAGGDGGEFNVVLVSAPRMESHSEVKKPSNVILCSTYDNPTTM